jgi:hypothetical protein
MRRQRRVCESAPELFFCGPFWVITNHYSQKMRCALCLSRRGNVIFMNGGEQLHSILIHIRRHSVEHKGAFCGGNAHEQNKTNICGCCNLWRPSCFSSNVWRFRRSDSANRQSSERDRSSFRSLLRRVLSSPLPSLRVLSWPLSSLLVALRS